MHRYRGFVRWRTGCSARSRIYIPLTALWLCLVPPGVGPIATADQFDPRLEGLFRSLKQTRIEPGTSPIPFEPGAPPETPTPSELTSESDFQPENASQIVSQITAIWAESDNPAIEILGRRVAHALDRPAFVIARNLAQSMVEISPSHVHGWYLLGTTFHRQAIEGHDAAYPKALEAYEHAIALEPRHFMAFAAAGEVAAALGQNDKAMTYLARARDIYPGPVSNGNGTVPASPEDGRNGPQL